MAGGCSVDPACMVGENLERASPDLLRALIKTFAEASRNSRCHSGPSCGLTARQRLVAGGRSVFPARSGDDLFGCRVGDPGDLGPAEVDERGG